jgi:hypothetical protein
MWVQKIWNENRSKRHFSRRRRRRSKKWLKMLKVNNYQIINESNCWIQLVNFTLIFCAAVMTRDEEREKVREKWAQCDFYFSLKTGFLLFLSRLHLIHGAFYEVKRGEQEVNWFSSLLFIIVLMCFERDHENANEYDHVHHLIYFTSFTCFNRKLFSHQSQTLFVCFSIQILKNDL